MTERERGIQVCSTTALRVSIPVSRFSAGERTGGGNRPLLERSTHLFRLGGGFFTNRGRGLAVVGLTRSSKRLSAIDRGGDRGGIPSGRAKAGPHLR